MSLDLERGRSFQITRRGGGPFQRALRDTVGLVARAVTSPAGAALVSSALGRKRARVENETTSMPRRSSRRTVRRRRAIGRGRGTRPVTRQNDQSITYSVGRGRGGRRSRGRRFRNRVASALNAMQPTQVWTQDYAISGASGVDLQQVYAIGLYQTNATLYDDLNQVFIRGGLDPATAANRSGRICIKNAVLDVELKNTGTETMIMDIYEIQCIRDPNTNADINAQFQTFFNETTLAGTRAWNNVSVSAFENPVFLRYYKILNKREVLLPADEIMTMQMRLPKSRIINADRVARMPNCIPKLAKFYLFMWHGPPDPNAGGAGVPGCLATSVTFTFQKAYHYAIMPGRTTTSMTNV